MKKRLLVMLLPILFCGQALAWGRQGHETVGLIAAKLIAGTEAERRVAALLEAGESLATAAEWPDCAKGKTYCNAELTPEMKEYGRLNKNHKHYHYTDVAFQLPAYRYTAVGTNPDDVVHVLREAVRVLQTGDVKDRLSQRWALMVLAHMVGDLHQPLHVGSAYVADDLSFVIPDTQEQAQRTFTEGGNWLCVGASGLHSLWDTGYVKRAMTRAQAASSADFAETLLAGARDVAPTRGDPTGWPQQWATQSLRLANRELKDITVTATRPQGQRGSCGKPQDGAGTGKMWTVRLPSGYAAQAVDQVPIQLQLAGARLAALLTAIWP